MGFDFLMCISVLGFCSLLTGWLALILDLNALVILRNDWFFRVSYSVDLSYVNVYNDLRVKILFAAGYCCSFHYGWFLASWLCLFIVKH